MPLLGHAEAAQVASAPHSPSFVARKIAELLRQARDHGGLDGFGFLQVDRERALLIDHIGVCERIKRTPLARVFSIKIRRFILLFLLTLPFGLLHRFATAEPLLVPLITMLVAYPILGLDQIGVELQNPFPQRNLSHLPLDAICRTITSNLLALLDAPDPAAATSGDDGPALSADLRPPEPTAAQHPG